MTILSSQDCVKHSSILAGDALIQRELPTFCIQSDNGGRGLGPHNTHKLCLLTKLVSPKMFQT